MNTPISEKNLTLVTSIIETIHYMDPDSPRFVDWLYLNRLKDGVRETSSKRFTSDNSKTCATSEFIQSMLPTVGEVKKNLTDRGFTDVDICTHMSNDLCRRIVVSDGTVILVTSAGADNRSILSAAVGDDELVKMHVDPVKEHYDSIRFLEYTALVGFSEQGPVLQNTLLNEVESLQMNGNDTFYPFIEGGVEKLAKDFAESDANVLLVYGEPGTGKSTLLRTLNRLMARDENYLIDDSQVIEDPRFTGFIRGVKDGSNITIEDADMLCGKRSEGNKSMSSILNQTDGIIKSKTKYLISTNLPTLRSVDEALYRAGRTFKAIQFVPLSGEEANLARKSIGLEEVVFEGKVTLSNALNAGDCNGGQKPVVGF